jgi:succinate dehydrogenase/fumarate reductase flavoprotein subunit
VPASADWPWRWNWPASAGDRAGQARVRSKGATAWAQGGIVGVLGSDDSIESHVRDTQEAGAGLVDEHTARFIAEHSAVPCSGWWMRACRFRPTRTARWACTSRAKAGMRCGASPMPPTPPARPSTTRCWRAPRRTRTSACASAGWRWT